MEEVTPPLFMAKNDMDQIFTRNKMKKGLFLLSIILSLVLFSCSKNKEKGIETVIPAIVNCSKLHTAQYNVHKILTYKDMTAIEGSIFSEKISIPIPGDRMLVIPIDATIRAYIDFSQFSKDNIVMDNDGKVIITLPNPQIVLSSAQIDYKNEKQYLSWNRSKFASEEKEEFIKQGRASILASMAHSDIIDRSRTSAFNTIQPILISAGFSPENIIIRFSDDIEKNKYSEQTIKLLTSIEE